MESFRFYVYRVLCSLTVIVAVCFAVYVWFYLPSLSNITVRCNEGFAMSWVVFSRLQYRRQERNYLLYLSWASWQMSFRYSLSEKVLSKKGHVVLLNRNLFWSWINVQKLGTWQKYSTKKRSSWQSIHDVSQLGLKMAVKMRTDICGGKYTAIDVCRSGSLCKRGHDSNLVNELEMCLDYTNIEHVVRKDEWMFGNTRPTYFGWTTFLLHCCLFFEAPFFFHS